MYVLNIVIFEYLTVKIVRGDSIRADKDNFFITCGLAQEF